MLGRIIILVLTCCSLLYGDVRLDVDRLFMQASDGAVRHRELVQPSKDSLVAMGDSAAKYLAFKLYTTDARERHTLTDIYREIGTVATPYLLDALNTDNKHQLKTAARCLGEIKDPAATRALLKIAKNDDYTIRSPVLKSLGQIGGDDKLAKKVSRYIKDSIAVVRKSCVVALGRIGSKKSLDIIVQALDDPHFSVRLTAFDALIKYDSLAFPVITDLLTNADKDRLKALALRLVGTLQISSTTEFVEKQLGHQSALVRGWAAWSWGRLVGVDAIERLQTLIDSEQNLAVKSLIKETIDYLNSPIPHE